MPQAHNTLRTLGNRLQRHDCDPPLARFGTLEQQELATEIAASGEGAGSGGLTVRHDSMRAISVEPNARKARCRHGPTVRRFARGGAPLGHRAGGTREPREDSHVAPLDRIIAKGLLEFFGEPAGVTERRERRVAGPAFLCPFGDANLVIDLGEDSGIDDVLGRRRLRGVGRRLSPSLARRGTSGARGGSEEQRKECYG